MVRSVLRALLGIVLFMVAPAAAGEGPITVMTRNLYLGADLRPILAAQDAAELLGAVGATFAAVQASDVEGRIGAIADEIVQARADLVGVQEGSLWRTGSFMTPATEVAFDFIALLLEALAARGESYELAAELVNFDVQFPGLTSAGLREIRLTDRDAILVRAGNGARVSWSAADVRTANFETNVVLATAFGAIPLVRGWASLDVGIGDTRARFLTTHLETLSASVQMAQAQELLVGPADTELPLILVCDCNSSADGIGPDATPTYGALLAAGFEDAWMAAHRHAPGFTCCQAGDLTNVPSELSERIDFVLLRGDVDVQHAQLTGWRLGDRTDGTPPLWPSDHAGVAATLKLPSLDHDDR
jgi:endonuclease/exonuclease/phosphatase family metal-dependent hydrolase